MLEMSLSHISRQTQELFEDYVAMGRWPAADAPYIPPIYPKAEYGWFIPLTVEPYPESCPSELQEMRRFGISHGHSWIMLDQDAYTIDGLETFDW